MSEHHPYEQLSPDVILDVVESVGERPDGSFLALNSYENRVYQIGIEDAPPLIAKFYRPDGLKEFWIRVPLDPEERRIEEQRRLEKQEFDPSMLREDRLVPIVPGGG